MIIPDLEVHHGATKLAIETRYKQAVKSTCLHCGDSALSFQYVYDRCFT